MPAEPANRPQSDDSDGSDVSAGDRSFDRVARSSPARLARPGYFALLVCVLLAAALVGFYVWSISGYVALPADRLMFSESVFLADMMKLRNGISLYSPPQDSNSMIYTPGSQLLTYGIARILGKTDSLTVLRTLQLGYVLLATLLATACCVRLRRLAFPSEAVPYRKSWLVFSFLCLGLAATAPQSNRYVHCLHVDALVLLVSVFCFWTMLRYVEKPDWKSFALMAICPAIGYLTKQLLLSWAGVIFVFLFVAGPLRIKRLVSYFVMTSACIGMAIAVCYLIWGDAFIFWTFTVTGGERSSIGLSYDKMNISLSRGFDTLMYEWMEVAIGVVGGWLILRLGNLRTLGPLWCGWAALILSEAFSSGTNWGIAYHFGPGVLLGTAWLMAALPHYWPTNGKQAQSEMPRLMRWVGPVVAIGCVVTVFQALRVVPTKVYDRGGQRSWAARRPSEDIYRYIADIESEFEGHDPKKILMDVGNWTYVPHNVLQVDRASPLAEQPCRHMYENFDPLLERIRGHEYEKILVQHYNTRWFLYDWHGWPRPTGVRQALLEYYEEVRIIPGASGVDVSPKIEHSGPVSVLVPRK